MGAIGALDHPSDAKRHSPRPHVHIPTQSSEPDGEGTTGQRIPASDGRIDARQQISRRQHVHEQDLGRCVGNLGWRDPRHGGGIPEQYAIQPAGFQGRMGRMVGQAGQVLRVYATGTAVGLTVAAFDTLPHSSGFRRISISHGNFTIDAKPPTYPTFHLQLLADYGGVQQFV